MVKQIDLTKGYTATIDADDADAVEQHSWCANLCSNGSIYAKTRIGGRKGRGVSLHEFLLGKVKGLQIDHIDGNTLNNCRSNLRHVNPSQNCMNRGKIRRACASAYKGVTNRKCRKSSPWQARIQVGDKRVLLGFFDTQERAARAYDVAAMQYFGPFARLNFPKEA